MEPRARPPILCASIEGRAEAAQGAHLRFGRQRYPCPHLGTRPEGFGEPLSPRPQRLGGLVKDALMIGRVRGQALQKPCRYFHPLVVAHVAAMSHVADERHRNLLKVRRTEWQHVRHETAGRDESEMREMPIK